MTENSSEHEQICIPVSEQRRIVVIGAGFAGISFIKRLKNKPFQIVLLDQNNFHQFQPLLYQVATSGIEPDSIVSPVRKLFKGYKNVVFRMAEVLGVDPRKKVITTNIGNINFDILVIATGSKTNYFGLHDIEFQSIGMKTIQEALDIRSLILQHFERAVITCDKEEQDVFTNFAIIGGGPAGVEMAGALAEFKRYILPKDYPELDPKMMSIYLIEANGKVLKTMSDNASEKALKYLQRMGVEVLLNTRVASYDGQFIKANEVLLEAKTVIWTAGVEGNLPEGIPQESVLRGKRIKVDGFLNLSYYKNIYAIGDVAALIDADHDRGHPMVAQVAIQQGELVAKNLLRGLKNQAPEKFVYKDKGSLATIGKRRAVADIGNFKFGGYFAWLLWSVVHLFSISGFRNKVIVGINWAWSYFTYDKGNRLIIRKYKEIPGNEPKVMYPFDE